MKHNMEIDSMEKATARPWEATVDRHPDGKLKGRPYIYSSDTGKYVAELFTTEESEPNAALIVRAVNSHEALIEAVEEAFTVIGEGMIDNCLTEEELPVYEALMTKLETALKLAKGA